MKTAMEKKEIGLMRQIGYLSFVVVLLYGLTLFAVSCDNDEDPPLPPAVEKVVLAFGVDQGEGQLSAKPELENTAAEKIGELISPAEIAKGTTVHFRATHSKSWTIMYWKVNGVIIRSVEPEQTFVIDEHKEVRVAFKPYKSLYPAGFASYFVKSKRSVMLFSCSSDRGCSNAFKSLCSTWNTSPSREKECTPFLTWCV